MPFTPRSQLTQVLQIGVETSPGTGGSPTHRLTTFNSQQAPVAAGQFAVFRPSGGKYAGQIVPGDMYSEGAITDAIDFNTLPWLCAGNVGYAAPTVAAGVSQWTFAPTPFVESTCKTFVVTEGVASANYTFRNVIVPDLGFTMTRQGGSTTNGRMLGRKMSPGSGALPAVTNPLAGRVVPSTGQGLFVASSWALLTEVVLDPTNTIPTTLRVDPPNVGMVFRHNNIFAPWFAMDDSIVSFYGTLEDAADAGVQFTFPADVDGTDIYGPFTLGGLEAGDRVFVKYLAQGPAIPSGGGKKFLFEINMCVQISGPPRRGTQGNVRTWQWDTTLVPDDSAGGSGLPFEMFVQNNTPDIVGWA